MNYIIMMIIKPITNRPDPEPTAGVSGALHHHARARPAPS